MFNKKELAEQKNQINELQKEVESLTSLTTNLKSEIKSLQSTNADLKGSLDKILDTLEGESFAKDWEAYQKYKEMKDKLPEIETMYKLKELKQAMKLLSIVEPQLSQLELQVINHNARAQYTFDREDAVIQNRRAAKSNGELEFVRKSITSCKGTIYSIIDHLKKSSDQKDILELFKLYAISEDWLKP